MAVKVASRIFTVNEMRAGTVPDAWIATLTITTWRGTTQSSIGSSTVLFTIVYE